MALDMGQKWGVPAKSGNVLENVGSGATAYGSGPAQELRASFAKDSVPDEFDRINQWLDTGDNKNLADAVRRVDNTHGAYTDADLIQKGGWTQEQIDEARKMNAALDAIPAWKRGVRRAANTIGGIGDTVAAAPVLGAEYGVQAGKNIDATLKNWKQVEQEVKGDEHAQSLFDLLTDVDMDYNPTWPESRNRELISMGYNSKEIREMRQKLAGLEVSDGIDKNQSVGYQLYDRGQKLTAAAQSGLSPTQRAVAGAVTSAAENLAVAGVNPAAVLPILSAQGAAEAMGQSAEKGESAGKALGGGLAKFGAGWAINSVGAADLAKTMGSDYAKDTLAGQIADWVQGLAGSSELAQRYPAVAAAISGGHRQLDAGLCGDLCRHGHRRCAGGQRGGEESVYQGHLPHRTGKRAFRRCIRRAGRRSRYGAGKAERRRRKPAGAGEVSRPDGPDGAGCRPAEGMGCPGGGAFSAGFACGH